MIFSVKKIQPDKCSIFAQHKNALMSIASTRIYDKCPKSKYVQITINIKNTLKINFIKNVWHW